MLQTIKRICNSTRQIGFSFTIFYRLADILCEAVKPAGKVIVTAKQIIVGECRSTRRARTARGKVQIFERIGGVCRIAAIRIVKIGA